MFLSGVPAFHRLEMQGSELSVVVEAFPTKVPSVCMVPSGASYANGEEGARIFRGQVRVGDVERQLLFTMRY
jgi:hypothetical protein